MKQARKNLKTSSIIVLIFAGLSLINIIFELFFGELNGALNSVALPDGSPDNVVLIAQIFILAISFLLLLPQLYIGFKGLKMAKNPDNSRGHIVWGIILFVFTALGLVSPFMALVRGNGEAFANISELLSIAVDVIVLFEYVKYAKAVRRGI